MKLFIGFLCGLIATGLLVLAIQTALPIRAQSENLTAQSDNLTQGLVELLPDVQKIYREALTSPLQEAGKGIYDEDIARFYHLLLQKTDLDTP